MNYSQTLQYLYSQLPAYHRVGQPALKPGLGNIIKLCEALQNPQTDFKSIHIAGTNGKGSVSHLLASVFMEAGYKVGLYTSPHLKDFRERIRVNGKKISKNYVVNFVQKHKELFLEVKPSFFEMTVAMAFSYFKDKKIQVGIIETGLGGRLDSTNIILPELSIITNISYDHVHLLGNTLEKIASEKAGIIKPDVPVVIGEISDKSVRKVFEKSAKANKAELIIASQKTFRHYSSPLLGQYQQKNIATVIASIPPLIKQGFKIDKQSLKKGIRNVIINTGLRGRWEILSKNPYMICDVAHNAAGISYVVKQLKRTPHKQLHFVLGLVNDKDITEILRILPSKNTLYYFTQAQISRALNANELKSAANRAGLTGNSYSSVKKAVNAAKRNYHKGDLIFIGGSFFIVAEAL
jgi:dihydrofolate synthase/folylpolyglutamate synthase